MITNSAQWLRNHFHGNLTGVFVVSGTRTTYILERAKSEQDPGTIDAFQEYANFLIPRYHRLIKMFFSLGGQNLIIPLYPYQVFYARGLEYAHLAMETTKLIIEGRICFLFMKSTTLTLILLV